MRNEQDKAQPIEGDDAISVRKTFGTPQEKLAFDSGFRVGCAYIANKHHPATDWDALRDKLKELCKYKININDDGINGIINFFKNELTK